MKEGGGINFLPFVQPRGRKLSCLRAGTSFLVRLASGEEREREREREEREREERDVYLWSPFPAA